MRYNYHVLAVIFAFVSLFQIGNAADIHQLTRDGKIVELEIILRDNPRAWDTGETYLGDTAVGVAVDEANLDILKLFVKYGYELHPRDWFDNPARLISPYTGRAKPEHLKLLKWIITQEDMVDDLAWGFDDFVKNDRLEATEMLLEYGVDPNVTITNGWFSSLDLAESEEMKTLLKSYGAESFLIEKSAVISIILVFLIISFIWISSRLNKSKKRGFILFFSIVVILIAAMVLVVGGMITKDLSRQFNFEGVMILGIVLFKVLPVLAIFRVSFLLKRVRQIKADQ